MKKIIVIIIIAMLSISAFAQEDETLLEGKIEHGGFGGPVVKFSNIKDEFALLVGGYGGWFVNHTFLIGAGGYGLATRINASDAAQAKYGTGEQLKLMFGYGGGVLEYVNKSNKLVHYSISTLIGAGGVVYTERDHYDYDENDEEDHVGPSDAVFVLEPALNIELNIASFFRVNAGASYRMVSGVNLEGLKNSDLSGPSANLALKFGLF